MCDKFFEYLIVLLLIKTELVLFTSNRFKLTYKIYNRQYNLYTILLENRAL